jgi:autotransporter-associated beta strand protein
MIACFAVRIGSIAVWLLFLLLTVSADGVVLYWDDNGTNPNTNGVWDTTAVEWAPTSTLTGSPVVWDPAAAAAFPGGSANVSNLTISVNTTFGFAGIQNAPGGGAGVGVTNLIINGAGQLNIDAGIQGFWTAQSYYNTIIRVALGGTGGVQNQSGGSLYLAGTNSYSGGTSLGTSAGLNFNNSYAFGTGPITNSLAQTVLATPASDSSGTAFAASPITISNAVQTFGTGGQVILTGRAAAPVTFSGPWTLAGSSANTAQLDVRTISGSTATWTISGPISGAPSLTKLGAATLVLSGSNTYSGKTTISGGTVVANSLNKVTGGTTSSSLGHPTTTANGTISIGATTTAAALIYLGAGETTDRIVDLAGTTGGATLQSDGSGPLAFTNNFTASGIGAKMLTLQGTNSGSNFISGRIVDSTSGTTGITKSGSGTWTLSGPNTYSGLTTMSAGLLQLGSATALGNGTVTLSGGSFDNTAASDITYLNSLTFNGNGTYIGSAHNTRFDGVITISGGNRTLTVTSNTVTFSQGVGQDTAGRGLTKAGAGTLVMRGSGTYSGNTTISGGTLAITNNGALGAGNYAGAIVNSGTLAYGSTATQTLSGVISGSGSLAVFGPGRIVSTAANTYSGATILRQNFSGASGMLVLSNSGSLGNGSIVIENTATLDVSARTSAAFTLGPSGSLYASGNGTSVGVNAATITGASGGSVSLGSRSVLLNYNPSTFNSDASHPSLYISQGDLVLNGNAFTITNTSGTALGPGTYVIMQAGAGNVTSNGFFSASILGSGVAAGDGGYITTSGGNVNLIVAPASSFSNLTPGQSVTYGATLITLSGKVSGAGPAYPAPGEAIGVGINGNVQSTTINDSTGDFSINYNLSGIPANATPYTITYLYGGNGTLAGSFSNGTTLTINKRPAALFGTRAYDGTTTAPAAILSVTNLVGADVVTVASGSGTLASRFPGVEPISSFDSLALGGASAGSYTMTGATGFVNVTSSGFAIIARGVDVTGTNFYLTWQSTPGTNYQIIATTNLSSPVWSNAGSPIAATSTTTSATNHIQQAQRFFQVFSE